MGHLSAITCNSPSSTCASTSNALHETADTQLSFSVIAFTAILPVAKFSISNARSAPIESSVDLDPPEITVRAVYRINLLRDPDLTTRYPSSPCPIRHYEQRWLSFLRPTLLPRGDRVITRDATRSPRHEPGRPFYPLARVDLLLN